MREHLVRHRLPSGHQHRRPDDSVEAGDVLADDVDVGRPEVLELRLVGAVPGRGDVVEQCLDPDVHDVLLVPRHLDAPVEGGTRHREVVQAAAHEGDDLVAGRRRLDEVGVGLVEVEQRLLVVRQPEEVVLLRHVLDAAAIERGDLESLVLALAVRDIVVADELLSSHAVVAGELALVDGAAVVEVLPERARAVEVSLLRGADEVVVGDVDLLQDGHPLGLDQPVGPLLRRDVVLLCLAQHLETVLVGAGEVPDVLAPLAVPPSDDVAHHRRVRMADVGRVVDVVDRRRDVERLVGCRWHALHPSERSCAAA